MRNQITKVGLTISTKLIIAIAFLLYSCSEQPEEKAIKSYIQKLGDNTTINLDVKILELEKIQSISGSDSLRYFDSILVATIPVLIRKAQGDSLDYLSGVEERKIKLKYETNPQIREIYQKFLKTFQGMLDSTTNQLKKIREGEIDNINENTIALTKARKHYESRAGKILALKYRCKYKFKNPLLGGVEQETTRYFIIDTLNLKVLKSL